MKFFIAGLKYHDFDKVSSKISEGDTLRLIPEPDNLYDPNAVRIETKDATMLGYVPRKFSSWISASLYINDAPSECKVSHIDLSAPSWNRCEVEVEE